MACTCRKCCVFAAAIGDTTTRFGDLDENRAAEIAGDVGTVFAIMLTHFTDDVYEDAVERITRMRAHLKSRGTSSEVVGHA